MAWFSYHGGHSGEFCKHAKGTLQGVLERAVEVGFSTYGVAEHGPRDRIEDLMVGEEGLTPDDLHTMFADYVAEATRLRDAFADRLEVLVGFESEVLPPDTWPERMRSLRQSLPECDFIIGSVHTIDGRYIDMTAELTDEVRTYVGGNTPLQRAYFGLVAQVAHELRPEIIGHFDLIRRFDGEQPAFSREVWPAIEDALEAVHAAGSALEVNCAPVRRAFGPVYPLPEILERARHMGIGVTLGDDSHGPQDVGVGLDASLRAIAAAGYGEVQQLTRIDGHVQRVGIPLEDVGPRTVRAPEE